MNRAERRRHAREHQKQPVLIAGDGIVAASLGKTFEARPTADLAPKVKGKHRFVAVAAYVMDDDAIEHAFDADKLKFLDNKNLMTLSVGCYDCEEPLGKISRSSVCRGGDGTLMP